MLIPWYPFIIFPTNSIIFHFISHKTDIKGEKSAKYYNLFLQYSLSAATIAYLGISMRGVTSCIFFVIWFHIKQVIHISVLISPCTWVLVWKRLTIILLTFFRVSVDDILYIMSLTTFQLIKRYVENTNTYINLNDSISPK